MATVRFSCVPEITSRVRIGGPGEHQVLIGRLRVSGRNNHPVHFDADNNFVVLEIGKRGSGKSFGMGSALEAFATVEDTCSLATHGPDRRGVLLLDPLDIHWTAIYPVQDGISRHMKEQYKLLSRWPEISVEPIKVNVYMPAGRGQPEDPAAFIPFQIPVTDLTPEDWGLLYGANIVSDPAGMLLWELYEKVTRLGYEVGDRNVAPKGVYGLPDLIACLDDTEIQTNYSSQTVRAVRQRLRTWHGDPLFQSDAGTSVTTLVKAGELSILCLNRLSEDMRSVITGVLVRKIKAARTRSSQRERRLAYDPSAEAAPAPVMPRTILAIDEAQMILPASGGGPARTAIESYILEGRNFGLSIWLATQIPRGAISPKAIKQLDSLLIHRLSNADDINAVQDLVQSGLPQKIKVNDREVDLAELIRSLEVGTAFVSSDSVERAFVMDVRPRVVAHGGKAF
jgi:uncharacterized protein